MQGLFLSINTYRFWKSNLGHSTRCIRTDSAGTFERLMKTRHIGTVIKITQGFAIAIATLWWQIAAMAQAPTGSLEYSFSAQDGVPLWNFSGAYSTPYYAVTNDTLVLHHFGKGNIYASYQEDPAGGAAEGTIRGANSNLRAKLLSKMYSISIFTDSMQQETAVLRKDTLTLTFDPGTMTLNGTDRTVIKNLVLVYDGYPYNHWKATSGYTFNKPVSLQVPETTDGNWNLELDIASAGNKLTGSALIRFTNGEVFQFQLAGTYLPSTQKTKILLKGQGEDKSANLVLSLLGPEMNVERMSGNVGGQRIRYPAH
jgi:hypothetical protein